VVDFCSLALIFRSPLARAICGRPLLVLGRRLPRWVYKRFSYSCYGKATGSCLFASLARFSPPQLNPVVAMYKGCPLFWTRLPGPTVRRAYLGNHLKVSTALGLGRALSVDVSLEFPGVDTALFLPDTGVCFLFNILEPIQRSLFLFFPP